jgi:hypothetical protein
MTDDRHGLETTGLTGRTYKLWASATLRANAEKRCKEGVVSLFVRKPNQKRFCFVGGFSDLGAASRAVAKIEAIH